MLVERNRQRDRGWAQQEVNELRALEIRAVCSAGADENAHEQRNGDRDRVHQWIEFAARVQGIGDLVGKQGRGQP
ncbi:hypothetical protein AYR66_09505 [Noviherbaspirillum denitrificans]|uniref:Uncharacterized protein n=1 Tax=Noviherbaspirillum denitrificans TaxID=1968433 RepID=A0A254TAM0_9BURK|nr:hypothetical protein AYR66_09505 [Noviherbaspirillum denitrificans]